MSSATIGKPARESFSAIAARLREVALVTSASGRSAARSRSIASTAPGRGFQETVSTPSMSIRTAPIRSIRATVARRADGGGRHRPDLRNVRI